MLISSQIVQLLGQTPNLNAKQIAEALNAKETTVKVTLHKMIKKERLVRMKVGRFEKSKAGPQSLYSYRVSEVKSDNANTPNG